MKNLVILGASGHLAREKLFPALWEIYQKDYKCNYIGYGRTEFSDNEFKKVVKESVKEASKDFIARFSYISGGYNFEGLQKIKDFNLEKTTIFYLSLPTRLELIQEVVLGLKQAQLFSREFRVVVEKPFGSDFETASELMQFLDKNIGKENLFLIDHYLSKDLVRNLISLRFANPVFENIWSNKYIEKIEIQALEKSGIENRGQYYDKTGAIKDMIQNHLLQMLALVLMDKPDLRRQASVEKQKSEIISDLRVFEGDYKDNILIDQYDGYVDEKFVRRDSLTETYSLIKAEVDSKRWQGVPIFLESGKKQPEKKTKISIYLKGFEECIWNKNCKSMKKNKLVLNIYPENDIQLFINSGYPDNKDINQIPLEFSFSENVDLSLPYANVLKDVYKNNKTYCPSISEILLSWKFIDGVIGWIDRRRKRLLKNSSE